MWMGVVAMGTAVGRRDNRWCFEGSGALPSLVAWRLTRNRVANPGSFRPAPGRTATLYGALDALTSHGAFETL
jgi:hypothetical protein